MFERDAELTALARQSVVVAGALRLLVERMGDLGWRLEDYSKEQLLDVAHALRGSAMTMAMETGNTQLLSEITGRRMHETDSAEWLRRLQGDDDS
ncbi:hypothetical protein [Streptomyces sp. NRRL S-350]|uniref:hypothetical protein n=1 Tax=Streptomyces sp. NRRL S-350 TaxID=1463902 RepID=UPI000AEE564E|nr:hypothetical protein [Streptomyces sp. NRRL S-350]